MGVVLFGLDGSTQDEYESLVNPNRDLGPQHIHGISMAELADAPSFEEVSANLIARLRDRIVVAHNSRFDVGFLVAEFQRAALRVPDPPHICTMRLATRDGLGRRLADVCESLSIAHSGAHTAIGDARAAGEIFTRWHHAHASHASLGLDACGCVGVPAAGGWPLAVPNTTALVRSEASRLAAAERGYLARLVDRLPPEATPASAGEAVYLDVLERALEDRHLSRGEGLELLAIAEGEGFGADTVRKLHDQFFSALAMAAWQDGRVSELEAADLRLVGEFLDVEVERVERALRESPLHGAGETPLDSGTATLPPGTTVCFTGMLRATIGGELISREQARELAHARGLQVRESVTKKLDVLVVADPQTASGKAKEARDYGTRILAEAAFWQLIGVATD